METKQYANAQEHISVLLFNYYSKKNKESWEYLFKHFDDKEIFSNELFLYALCHDINTNNTSKSLLTRIYNIDKQLLVPAIKNTKMFLHQNKYYEITKELLTKDDTLNEFGDIIKSCDTMAEQYRAYEAEYLEAKKELMKYPYFHVMMLFSIYSVELLAHFEGGMVILNKVLIKILQDRTKEKDKRKKSLTRAEMDRLYSHNFSMFLQDGPNKYKDFSAIAQAYFEFLWFEINVLSAFSYDKNYETYFKENKKIDFRVVDKPSRIKWLLDEKKTNYMLFYYYEQSLAALGKNAGGYKKGSLTFAEGMNVNYASMLLIVKDIYGFNDNIKLITKKDIPITALIRSMLDYKYLFTTEYLSKFLLYFQGIGSWKKSLLYLMQDEESESKIKTRLPLFCHGEDSMAKFSKLLYEDYYLKEEKLDDEVYKEIEDVLTIDLDNVSLDGPLDEYTHKIFYKINNFCFSFPFMTGHEDNIKLLINNLFKLRSRASERKDEASLSGERLAKLFEDKGFTIKTELDLPAKKGENEIGDTDLICEKDGYMFVFELKSTFIRIEYENIFNYKKKALVKAAIQLIERKNRINFALSQKRNELIKDFGRPKKIFYYIVDTSTEFDHERICGYLKISMFELIYILTQFFTENVDVDEFVKVIEEEKSYQSNIKL